MFQERTLLRAIADGLVDTAYATDLEGRCIWVSPADVERLGLEYGDVIGKRAEDIFGETFAHVPALERLVIEGGEPLTREETVTVDGESRRYLITRVPLRDESGEIIGVAGGARDVTREREAHAALAQVAAQLGQAESLAGLGSFEWHVAEDRTYFSPALRRLLDLDGDTAPTDYASALSLVYPDDRERIAALVDEALRTGKPARFQTRMVLPGGGVRHLDNRLEAITDEEGGVRVVGVAQDVTEAVWAREELETRTEQLVLAQRLAGLGVWGWEPDSDGFDCSDALMGILGVEPGEAPGTFEEYLGFVHPGDRGMVAEAVWDARAERDEFTVTHRIVKRGGEVRAVECRGSMAPGESGRVVGICQDRTDQSRREDALRHRADHDPLTGLLARDRFECEVRRQLALTDRYGWPCAVLAVDVDDFKQVNDTHGHPAGDLVLRRVAKALLNRLRDTDLIARMGGDEFAILLPNTTREQGAGVAEALMWAARGEDVTVSIGVAAAEAPAAAADDVVGRADQAMFRAKQAGRDGVALA